jgi:hypothetical protein
VVFALAHCNLAGCVLYRPGQAGGNITRKFNLETFGPDTGGRLDGTYRNGLRDEQGDVWGRLDGTYRNGLRACSSFLASASIICVANGGATPLAKCNGLFVALSSQTSSLPASAEVGIGEAKARQPVLLWLASGCLTSTCSVGTVCLERRDGGDNCHKAARRSLRGFVTELS